MPWTQVSLFGGCPSVTGFSGGGVLSPGIARCPESQAARSIRRQRSLQNGRNGAVSQSKSRWHVGHLTRAGLIGATAASGGSGAAAQHERDVVRGLRRARGDAMPREEADAAAVVTAADLR